jgi:hypothetical protein
LACSDGVHWTSGDEEYCALASISFVSAFMAGRGANRQVVAEICRF